MTETGKTWGSLKREDSVERETLISALQTVLDQVSDKSDAVVYQRVWHLFREMVKLRRKGIALSTPEARKRIFDIVYPE